MNDNPFDELSESDQRAAIDIACAVSILITRLPGLIPQEVSSDMPAWMDTIGKEFAINRSLSTELSREALAQIGQQLFNNSWRWNVTKETDATISTYFKQGPSVEVEIDGN